MNSTMTKPPVGQRIRIVSMPGGRHIGAVATVSDKYEPYGDNQIAVTIEGTTMETQNDCWIVDEWECMIPVPGDKVIPLNPDFVGIPREYHGKVGTVTSAYANEHSPSGVYISAEFQSHQKPDDTTQWSFNFWKPADGHTLTVSDPYRPTVGDKVTITGYLSNEGIIDTVAHDGYIRAVDGDIWTIDSPLYGRQVSGPGYITLVLAASEGTEPGCGVDGCTECEQVPVTPALPHEEPRIITELREEAATIKRELDRANERVEEFRVRASKWERDFMRYSERIMQEANERDWCSEYDRIMNEISGDLEIATIPEREQDVDIEWEETYTVTVKRSGTARLRSGYDSSDLERAARDLNGESDASRDEIIEAVRDGEYESCDFVRDSAEEA